MQSPEDFFDLSADFQNCGRETAPADLFLRRRRTFRKFLLGFVLSACALVSPSALAQSGQPNIIVILADDLGYGDVGFNGCPDYPTPNIDSVTINGVRCSSGYVTHPFCSPTRAALMTGRYQQRFGHERNPYYDPNDHREGLPMSETLLPARLRPAGYATGWIGKWHLGAAPEFAPHQRGFAETYGFIGGGHRFREWKTNVAVEYTVPIERNGVAVETPAHLTEAFGREAAAFV